MNVKVQKWGNSLAVRIPKTLADEIDVKQGARVSLYREENKIIIEPSKDEDKLTILLAAVTPENIHDEIETGERVGNEIW